MSLRRARTLVLGGLTLAAYASSACGSHVPRVDRFAHAIASSDSLRHRPLPDRKLVGLDDLPVASPVDSDSVAWLDINQRWVMPKGWKPTL